MNIGNIANLKIEVQQYLFWSVVRWRNVILVLDAVGEEQRNISTSELSSILLNLVRQTANFSPFFVTIENILHLIQ